MKDKIKGYLKKLNEILRKPEMAILPSNIAFNIILAIIPIKSANKLANKLYLIFFIPMHPKYKLITYKVVSVHPCITDPSSPIKLSGPYLVNILLR